LNAVHAKKYPFLAANSQQRIFTAHLHCCNNDAMQYLRSAKLIARFMLAWFALSIGVAIGSPMVKPQGMQLICSGSGAMTVVAAGDDGKVPSTSHTLDCPLCSSLSAPPPMEILAFGKVALQAFTPPLVRAESAIYKLASPPPARGPPSFS
jgi:hypothetical protein